MTTLVARGCDLLVVERGSLECKTAERENLHSVLEFEVFPSQTFPLAGASATSSALAWHSNANLIAPRALYGPHSGVVCRTAELVKTPSFLLIDCNYVRLCVHVGRHGCSCSRTTC